MATRHTAWSLLDWFSQIPTPFTHSQALEYFETFNHGYTIINATNAASVVDHFYQISKSSKFIARVVHNIAGCLYTDPYSFLAEVFGQEDYKTISQFRDSEIGRLMPTRQTAWSLLDWFGQIATSSTCSWALVQFERFTHSYTMILPTQRRQLIIPTRFPKHRINW